MNRRALLVSFGALFARPALALYDPAPNSLLTDAVGAWRGTLTYRDYQDATRTVVLPTRLTVSLTAPAELALYYVFDDGPGKAVHSYERMTFDFARNELTWTSGTSKPDRSVCRIRSASTVDGRSRIDFEESVDSGLHRYSLDITGRTWRLAKTEVGADGAELQRNKYELGRVEA